MLFSIGQYVRLKLNEHLTEISGEEVKILDIRYDYHLSEEDIRGASFTVLEFELDHRYRKNKGGD